MPSKINQHSDEINAIIFRKPKYVIRLGTIWILLLLTFSMVVLAYITPVTLIYEINIKSKNEKVLTFTLNTVGNEADFIDANIKFPTRLILNEDQPDLKNSVNCKILAVNRENELLKVTAVLNQKLGDDKILYRNYKFIRVDNVPFLDLLIFKIRRFVI
ncbi:MAG: hypothetical protein K0R59_2014 [Sphingobacterium sp.]|jgi:hypothetical protein|nr:hypothetical protein [Sphingobacterium sp.]